MSITPRIRAAFSWLRRHPVWASLLLFLAGFATLNLIAYQHARAMLWFAAGGPRTVRPQMLSWVGKLNVLLTGVRVPRPENDQFPADLGLDCETTSIPVDSQVTLEAWFIPSAGARETVVLFHGYAASKSEMLPEAAAFHQLGLNVWLVDFRGSGGSSERCTTIGVNEAEDVAATVDYLRAHSFGGSLLLYGRSMGAAAILRAIHVHDVQPDAVILESVFDRMTTTVGNRFQLMGLPAFPAANLLIFWGGVAAGFDGRRHNPAEYAVSCRSPTLMLHGELDPNARLEEGRNVLRNLGDHSSELVVFPKTGHSPTLAADPKRWLDAVDRLRRRTRP